MDCKDWKPELENEKEWRRQLWQKVNDIEKEQKAINEKMSNDRSRISSLEVKSGFWGMIGGALVIFGKKLIE